MNAKECYRQRQKLRAALTRVAERLDRNAVAGISPDRTTALMAVQVIGMLMEFGEKSGLKPDEINLDRYIDRSRFIKFILARRKETAGRRRRRQNQRFKSRIPDD
jgi:hypothetical protein